MVVTWFASWQGKAWVSKMQCHTNQSIFRTPIQREGTNRINLSISYRLWTPVNDPSLLWQLPCELSKTHRTWCCCTNQVTILQGHIFMFGNTSSHLGTAVATLSMHPICGNPVGSVVNSLYTARASDFWLLGGISVLWARMCKTVRTASGSCRWIQMPFHMSWPF